MSVPKQLRDQAEQIKQFYETTPEGGDPQNPSDPSAEPPVRDPEDTPHTPHDGGDDGVPDNFEQKWRSLQGSYNAQMRRNGELEQRLNQMQTLIATMTEVQTQSPPQAQQQDDYRLLSEDEVSEYGESVDVMRKVSREELTPLVQRMMQIERSLGDVTGRIVPQVQGLADQQHQTAEQNFWGSLAQLVPDWREVNEDAEFQGWLLEVDPLTGSTRQAFLEQAQQRLDAGRVAQFFMTWKGAFTQPAPARRGNGASSPLEMQVAPGRSRSSPPSARNQTTYTTADISKFYDDVRKGVYKGRDEEKGRLERDIFSAQQEGRILG